MEVQSTYILVILLDTFSTHCDLNKMVNIFQDGIFSWIFSRRSLHFGSNFTEISSRESNQQCVGIGSGNSLVQSGNKRLPELMFIKISSIMASLRNNVIITDEYHIIRMYHEYLLSTFFKMVTIIWRGNVKLIVFYIFIGRIFIIFIIWFKYNSCIVEKPSFISYLVHFAFIDLIFYYIISFPFFSWFVSWCCVKQQLFD